MKDKGMEKGMDTARLISALAHDFRTPLANVDFYAAALDDGTVPEGERSRYLKLIRGEAARLSQMTEELLALATAECVTATDAPFDFGECVRTALIAVGDRAEAKGLLLEAAVEDLTARGDKSGAMRVISNLLENAVKYTEKGGSIRLRAFAAEGKARLELENSTPIAQKDRERLFEPFYKGEGASLGNGLGLYSVKTTLERMGTEIELYGEDRTVFAFSLPLKK